jgi:hypothetical protein
MSSLERSRAPRRGVGSGVVGWSLLTLGCFLLGLLVPGLGLVLAPAVALTALRGNKRGQAVCLAIGLLSVLLLLVGVYGLQGDGGHGVVTHTTRVSE